jgi:acyl-CoA thioester hydrolase
MGTVYYGNYPAFYEVGRVEAMRSLGISYRKIEESGVMMPVLECHIKYHLPAKYDELLTLETQIPELPTAKIRFDYRIFSQEGKLINSGYTWLAFVDSSTFRPVRAPKMVLQALEPYFNG